MPQPQDPLVTPLGRLLASPDTRVPTGHLTQRSLSEERATTPFLWMDHPGSQTGVQQADGASGQRHSPRGQTEGIEPHERVDNPMNKRKF